MLLHLLPICVRRPGVVTRAQHRPCSGTGEKQQYHSFAILRQRCRAVVHPPGVQPGACHGKARDRMAFGCRCAVTAPELDHKYGSPGRSRAGVSARFLPRRACCCASRWASGSRGRQAVCCGSRGPTSVARMDSRRGARPNKKDPNCRSRCPAWLGRPGTRRGAELQVWASTAAAGPQRDVVGQFDSNDAGMAAVDAWRVKIRRHGETRSVSFS